MKIPILTDTHIHAWKAFALPYNEGNLTVTTRVRDTLIPFVDTISYANKLKQMYVFNGDLFHSRVSIDSPVFVYAYKKIKEIHEKYPKVQGRYIPGNHDMFSRTGAHILEPFKDIPGITVYDTPTLERIHGFDCVFVPFIEDPDTAIAALRSFKKKKSADLVLFAHLGIDGAKTGAHEYIPKEQISVDDIPSCYDLVCLGHYHTRQYVRKGPKPVFYAGSPIQFTKEDIGKDVGTFVLDLASRKRSKLLRHNTVPSIWNTHVDDIVGLTDDNLLSFKNQFVYLTSPTVDHEDVERLQRAGALVDVILERQVSSKQAERLQIEAGASHETILKEFINYHRGDKSLDRGQLLKTGLELLEE